MRRFLRWIFGLDQLDDTSARALQRRLGDLSDDLAHLGRRIDRLQGQVTGAIRYAREFEDEDDEDDEEYDRVG